MDNNLERKSQFYYFATIGQLTRSWIHTLNHHLNPIILALSDILIDVKSNGELTEEAQRSLLEKVGSAVDHTRQAILITRLIGRSIMYEPSTSIVVKSMLREVCELSHDIAERSQLKLEIRMTNEEITIVCDRTKLIQSLLNLIIFVAKHHSSWKPGTIILTFDNNTFYVTLDKITLPESIHEVLNDPLSLTADDEIELIIANSLLQMIGGKMQLAKRNFLDTFEIHLKEQE